VFALPLQGNYAGAGNLRPGIADCPLDGRRAGPDYQTVIIDPYDINLVFSPVQQDNPKSLVMRFAPGQALPQAWPISFDYFLFGGRQAMSQRRQRGRNEANFSECHKSLFL
jgi:hypothetical protein